VRSTNQLLPPDAAADETEAGMRSRILVLALALGISSWTLAAWAHEGEHATTAPEKQVTIVGELIDSACYTASDGGAKGDGHAACARKCLSTGIPAAILPDGSKKASDLRFLLTNPKPLAQYAAHTVRIEGTVHDEMHAIDVSKIWVKDGDKWIEIKLDDEHHQSEHQADDHAAGAPMDHSH
jgi:hypothetical protein